MSGRSCKFTLKELAEEIIGIDEEVVLLDGTRRRYINFDNAASTPALGLIHKIFRGIPPENPRCIANTHFVQNQSQTILS